MKHLFFVAVASGIFSGSVITAKAQGDAGTQRAASVLKTTQVPLKFIEDIEMLPAGTAGSTVSADVIPAALEVTVSATKPLLVKTAFTGSIERCSALQFKYAMMTNREVEAISNFSLYNFIDHWWATPYQYGGADSNGIDCSAFTGKLLAEVYGVTLPRVAKDQYKFCEKLDMQELAEGDLVFFNTKGGVSHVGFYLGNNYFVHSSVHDGVTISSLADDYYNRKFIAGGRVTPVAESSVTKAP